MFNHSSQFDRLALVSAAAVILSATLNLDARGWQHPPTPCPCAADGVCRPNGPWGVTPTKWRPWPGDSLDKKPITAEEEETREQLQLPPFELPPIVKEGQRGPNITKPPKAKRDDDATTGDDAVEAAEQNALEPAAPLPVADPLEAIDPEAFDIQDDFNLEPPVEGQAPQDDEPQPEFNLEDEADPEVDPLDDFDPFSRLDRRKGAPATSVRRTSLAPAVRDDAPPQLPPSLRKLSRRPSSTPSAPLQQSRFRRPAVALAR